MGVLGWSPDQFWRATVWDLQAALRGLAELNGDPATNGLSDQDIDELKLMLQADGA